MVPMVMLLLFLLSLVVEITSDAIVELADLVMVGNPKYGDEISMFVIVPEILAPRYCYFP